MKPNMSVFVALLFLELFAISTINASFSSATSYTGCIESERLALLKLKQDLNDPSNRLASWIGDGDCCKWVGVVCNNFTGHVRGLYLGNPFSPVHQWESYNRSRLVGKINHSLLDFKHLIHLDLSGNDFQEFHIPKFLGSLENLRYLNLSQAKFTGMIPHQLGNLSNLQYLDLSGLYNKLHGLSISWLSGLSLLEHLDMSDANLSKASDSLLVINSLPSLKELKLSFCHLQYFPPLSSANFSFLNTLDLSTNYFQGQIPNELGNLTSLRYLNLAANHFNSTTPRGLSNLNNIEHLFLSNNNLQGTISSLGLENMTSIQTLDFFKNFELEGKIPTSFARLCNLKSLYLSYVKLSQDISEILNIFSPCIAYSLESLDLYSCKIFGQLTNSLGLFKKLNYLELSDNMLNGSIPFTLGQISQLENLHLSNNKLNGSIPSTLGQISQLKNLDLSNNKLSGLVSEIHFVNLTKLDFFRADGNSLTFKVSPNWVPPFQLVTLRLRSCHLGPQFPSWLHSQRQLYDLDISNTGISDNIPRWFWNSIDLYGYLDLSSNQIYGEIPVIDSPRIPLNSTAFFLNAILDLSNNALSGSIFNFICRGKDMYTFAFLKLSKNLFSGDIPDCWMNLPYLRLLDLGNNNFSGGLPISIGALSSLQSLNLHGNTLSGIIPISLQNCTGLIALDLGENEFVGNIPKWIGESLSYLSILSLRSNKFHGIFPIQLCYLNSLKILDVANNILSGTIPRCINNFSAMATTHSSQFSSIEYTSFDGEGIFEDISVLMKGFTAEYNSILNLVRIIDLSKNNFSGEIPVEVTNLKGLQSLNFSHNFFTGKIPESIGSMRSIESLDLSSNQILGKIPESLSTLSFLNHLNLSNNNLTGKIPSSTQLQSFSAACFASNDLCGAPLPNCDEKNAFVPEDQNGRGNEEEDDVDWLMYVSMALGFVVGFWCFIGPLLINRRWRYKYCHFLDGLGDKFRCL